MVPGLQTWPASHTPPHASVGGTWVGSPQVPLSIEQAWPGAQMTAPHSGSHCTTSAVGAQLVLAAGLGPETQEHTAGGAGDHGVAGDGALTTAADHHHLVAALCVRRQGE